MGISVQTDFEATVRYLEDRLGVGQSFDIIERRLRFGEARLAAFIVNGFFQSLMVLDTLADAQRVAGREASASVLEVIERRLPYVQVTTTADLDQAAAQVLAGPLVLVVEGGERVLVVDTRAFPGRSPNEPDTEEVVRGPHDGFIETLIFNTALVRRRIRDPRLRFELVQVGRRSKTDVALGYVDGLTSPQLVAELRHRLHLIDIDGIPMGEQTVAEFLTHSPWNPFPEVRFTERPDVAAFHLLEGHAVILVDTTPQAIIAPSTFFNHIHHPEDFHTSPLPGTLLRWVVLLAIVISVLLPPAWLLFATSPAVRSLVPSLAFIGPKQVGGLSLALQFVLAELAIDILRRAILNTPHPMAAAMGILGAVVLGDAVLRTGLFSAEVIVYMVIATLSGFATSSPELAMANRVVRLSLVLLIWAGGWVGGLVGLAFWAVVLLRTRSFGIPYLWPLVPFNWGALRGILVRRPATARDPRPLALHPLDRTRRP